MSQRRRSLAALCRSGTEWFQPPANKSRLVGHRPTAPGATAVMVGQLACLSGRVAANDKGITMNIIWRLAAYAAASVVSASANAAIVNIKFSGVMQSNSPQYAGEKFSGFFEYNPDQVLVNFGTPQNPRYPYLGTSLTTTPFGTTKGNLQFLEPTCAANGRCRYSFSLFNRNNTLDTISFVLPKAIDIKNSLDGKSFAFTSYSSFTAPHGLGSGLIGHSQNMTVAAR